jgi:hypothetical protein
MEEAAHRLDLQNRMNIAGSWVQRVLRCCKYTSIQHPHAWNGAWRKRHLHKAGAGNAV